MTLFQETGIRCPEEWYFTYEVCADNGYGYKLGEYEQFNVPVIKAEMAEIIDNKRTPEEHHRLLRTIVNVLSEPTATADDWMDTLEEYLNEVNYTCKGDFD